MEIPNYMDIKNLADFTIRRIVKDIEKDLTDELLAQYLEKYGCKNTTELVYLFLCEAKPNDLNISLNMRQKSKNISEEVHQSESEDEHSLSKTIKARSNVGSMAEEIELMKIQQRELSQIVQEITQINKTLNLKLQKKNQSDLGL